MEYHNSNKFSLAIIQNVPAIFFMFITLHYTNIFFNCTKNNRLV